MALLTAKDSELARAMAFQQEMENDLQTLPTIPGQFVDCKINLLTGACYLYVGNRWIRATLADYDDAPPTVQLMLKPPKQ